MDMGMGTGILSLFASQAGAKLGAPLPLPGTASGRR